LGIIPSLPPLAARIAILRRCAGLSAQSSTPPGASTTARQRRHECGPAAHHVAALTATIEASAAEIFNIIKSRYAASRQVADEECCKAGD
jgi:hypothetical protein